MRKKHLFFLILLCNNFLFAQNKDQINIGFLLDNYSAEVAPILKDLKSEIKAVVGEDALVEFLPYDIAPNNYNIDKVTANYEALNTGDADIIIAFGPVSNLVLGKQTVHEKPTILFGTVNSDLVTLDETQTSSRVHNFNYLITSESYKKDIETFKSLYDFKNIAVLVESFLPDLISMNETFDELMADLGASYTLVPYQTVEDIKGKLNGVDAVYLTGGFFFRDSEIKDLAQFFIDNKLPSFTQTTIEDVQLGLMATNQAKENLNQFYRRIALNVERIVNGVDASDLPTFIDNNDVLTVNYNTAERLNVPIKYSLIAQTNFVGNFGEISAKRKYNLLDVMNETVKNNLSLQSKKKNIDLKAQDVNTAKSNYFPDVSASAQGTHIDPNLAKASGGLNPEYSTSGNITLRQNLFSEQANANITVEKQLEKAERENYNTAELDAIFDASTAYFNALILKANTRIQSQNLELTKRNLEIAKQNFEAGQTGKTDVLRFKSELAQNTQTFVEALNQLEQSFLALNLILNNDMDSKIDVEDVELTKGIFEDYNYKQLGEFIDDPTARNYFVKFLIQEAKTNAPELASLNYNIKANERVLRLNSSGRFVPTLALQAQYNKHFNRWGEGSTPGLGFDSDYNVGLSLSLPIFQQNRQNINKQIAHIQQDQLNLNKSNVELSIDRNINEAVLELVNEITNIELSRISEEAAKESLELVQTSYSNGAVNIIQLLDAQRNFLNAQLSQANAIYNYLLGSMKLERYLGSYFLLNTEAENEAFIQRFNAFLLNQN
ncbi:TolC family protein [Tamlana sp. 2201CG12-4]|uniref:TolC family protein n=1 Tax=Tamlana sp. 2201CG12-4 TaxID=3112582 RepID=UPI002DBF27D7|nr:TolC family protein [Tamlana sp. 2201CG12-4]MEC3906782.1 TolC family protein [Tamlana sp. 2201CG12-4]